MDVNLMMMMMMMMMMMINTHDIVHHWNSLSNVLIPVHSVPQRFVQTFNHHNSSGSIWVT